MMSGADAESESSGVKDHRCKERASELRDEILFKQPESSHLGDCPICFLPLPIDVESFTMMSCCSKMICVGCDYANHTREVNESLEPKCPFCRHPKPETVEEIKMNVMKRVEANDPVAMCNMGALFDKEGECTNAFKYWGK
jgi:2-keto-4-pentenoate hydratase/2-oxohepta-3-ene-1,7-dioic acid hydratase in catechol pathway